MNVQKVLTTAVLGVGLGALTLPGIALANVSANPSVAPVGTTITLTARCKAQSKAPRPSATFHIKGPRKDHRSGSDSDRSGGSGNDRGSGWGNDRSSGPGSSPGNDRGGNSGSDRGGSSGNNGSGWGNDRGGDSGNDRGSGSDKDRGAEKDIRVESTGSDPKMPETVSAQVPTEGWKPGEYDVTATCNDGTVAGETTFTLTPQGGPRGGEGGPSGSGTLVAAGTAMIGAGAAGFVLLRRRRPATAAG